MTYVNLKKIISKNDGISCFAVNQEKCVEGLLKSLLSPIVYLKKQGDLLNWLGLGQVYCMDFANCTNIPSIIACLFDLF